jgi:hypothetical protein
VVAHITRLPRSGGGRTHPIPRTVTRRNPRAIHEHRPSRRRASSRDGALGDHDDTSPEEDDMLRVFGEGDDVFRLEDADGARVGTIRNRAIAIHGFATERDARDGAVAAWHAMNGSLRRAYPSWPRQELATEHLETTHDGDAEWLGDGTRAIARLIRATRGLPDYGIELLLPSYATEFVAISAANAIALAVEPYRDESAIAAPTAARAAARPSDELGAPLAG